MNDDKLTPRTVRLLTALVNCLGHTLGATLTLMYLTLLESEIEAILFQEIATSGLVLFRYFSLATAILVALAFLVSFCFPRSLWLELAKAGDAESEEGFWGLAGRLMNVPLLMAGFAAVVWVLSGVALGVYLVDRFDGWHIALRVSLGIVLVGAPFTVLFIYFVLDTILRESIVRLFPRATLLTIPPCFGINVLPRLITVILTVSIPPMGIFSYFSLIQIHKLHMGEVSVSQFVSHMPTVIFFFSILGLVEAIGVSILVARSISVPLRQAGRAMAQVGKGDLDATVPVLSNDELGVAAEGLNRMVKELRERDKVRRIFGIYVSEEVVEEILRCEMAIHLEGELRTITILVSDLREFTPMTQHYEPSLVLKLINRYFDQMTGIIQKYGGTVDAFTGDGILAFFGAPRLLPQHQKRAVECAIEMQRAMPSLNEENAQLGLPLLKMGIGINSGELIVGDMGAQKRKTYGAVGSAINIAFRIEGQTRGDDIVITDSVYDVCRDELTILASKPVMLKGVLEPITIHFVSVTNGG